MDGPSDAEPGPDAEARDAPESFDRLAERLRAGHESAAGEMVDRYARRLVGLARKRLPPAIARKVDPEDVMQSAFRSFFAGHGRGRFDRLGDWDETWRLLALITNRKCRRKIAEFHAQRRDVRRERHLEGGDDDSGRPLDIESPDPTASQAAMLVELVEGLLKELDPRERRIVELALEGRPPEEIARAIGRSGRTVDRALRKLRLRLEQIRDDAP